MQGVTLLGDILVSLFAAYHLVTGAVLLGPTRLTRWVAQRVYHLSFPDAIDARYDYSNKIVGLYSIYVGAIGLLAVFLGGIVGAWILMSFLGLSLLRIFVGIYYRHLTHRALGQSVNRVYKKAAINLILLLFMYAWGLKH